MYGGFRTGLRIFRCSIYVKKHSISQEVYYSFRKKAVVPESRSISLEVGSSLGSIVRSITRSIVRSIVRRKQLSSIQSIERKSNAEGCRLRITQIKKFGRKYRVCRFVISGK